MRVLALPADKAACGHLRIAWPAEVLRGYGCKIDVIAPGEGAGMSAVLTRSGQVVDVVDVDYDVIVVQRPMSRRLADVLRLHQAKGIRIVVDLDDDLGAVHPSNSAWDAVHPKSSPESNWQVAAEVCRTADMVTVTTPELADRYGGHGRVRVVENCIPRGYLDVTKERLEHVTVGWSGWVGTHPADLQVTRGAVGRALERTGARFRNVGPGEGVADALGIPAAKFDSTEWVEIRDWPDELAKLDVGIVPLEGSRFNAAKSALKGLEFAAVGVPFVASAVPAYERLARRGAGMLATKPKVWQALVRMLINEPQARADLAARGRTAAGQLVLEDHAAEWWEAWTGEKVTTDAR